MPRARRITPEFWLDRELATQTERTRLVYIGSWNFADCNGIIENDTERIRVQVFPYKNLNIQSDVDALIKIEKYIPYAVDGKKYLWIRNFKKYQQLKKPNYRFPIPPPEVLSQYPTSVPPVDPQCLKKPKPNPKQNKKKNTPFSSEKKTKRYYQNLEMRFSQNKWWVIPKDGGQWSEFDMRYFKDTVEK